MNDMQFVGLISDDAEFTNVRYEKLRKIFMAARLWLSGIFSNIRISKYAFWSFHHYFASTNLTKRHSALS